MTRINVVPVKCLTDKHLMAEYCELPRIFTAVLKAQDHGKTPSDFDIPKKYCLGKGHVTFFYNKISFLYERFAEIYTELKYRKFNIDSELYMYVKNKPDENITADWWGDWTPEPEDMYLNMARLLIM